MRYDSGYHYLAMTNNMANSINRHFIDMMPGPEYVSMPSCSNMKICEKRITEHIPIEKPIA